MSQKSLNEISKFLSYVLRHEPQSIGLTLDAEGWADLDVLIEGADREGRALDRALLETVVSSSDKKRFELCEDQQRIRAVQGHSTEQVSRQYPEKTPPHHLYHGTATRFLESIEQQGLIAGARHHVHLSPEIQTAVSVGQRYGKPVVLTVQAGQMHEQGFRFYEAENGVWLTEHVPMAFIQKP